MEKLKLYTEEQVKDAIKMARSSTNIFTTPFLYDQHEILDILKPFELPTEEEMAIFFHEKYEELAPSFGYTTRDDTRNFDKDSKNGKLMIEVCKEVKNWITTKQKNMAQQTAVMQLIKFILVERRQEDGSIKFHAHEDFSRFLQMEKEQIMKAVYDSMGTNFDPNMGRAEQYYNETYNK